MPALLHRTTTHLVLDSYLETRSTDPKVIQKELLKRKSHRRISDIKAMLTHLRQIGIVENKEGERLVQLLRSNFVRTDERDPRDVFIAEQMLNHLMSHGLAVYPFLHAVKKYPNQNTRIQVMTAKYGKEYGFYNLRGGDDVSAAMRNFLAYLGFMKPGRGVYELTPLCHEIIELEETQKENILERVRCDAGENGEPCREICPVNAISYQSITSQCIECGLCTVACPYGAIMIDCEGRYTMDTQICLSHSGSRSVTGPCSLDLISSEELELQQWLRSLFVLSDLPAEIPGVGEYPDIVTAKAPTFIEVKRGRLTSKVKEKLLRDQLPRYMNDRVIQSTLERLKVLSDFETEEPEMYIVITQESSLVNEFLSDAKRLYEKRKLKPISFISYNSLFQASLYLKERLSLKLDEFWSELKPWHDESLSLQVHVKELRNES